MRGLRPRCERLRGVAGQELDRIGDLVGDALTAWLPPAPQLQVCFAIVQTITIVVNGDKTKEADDREGAETC